MIDLDCPQFSKVRSGYKPEEVDEFISQLSEKLDSLANENAELEEKLMVLAESIQNYKDEEDSLRDALLNAHKMADSIVKSATNKSEIAVREATIKAAHIIEEANNKVEEEKQELLRIQQSVSKFKNDLLEMYKNHINEIYKLPSKDEKENEISTDEPVNESSSVLDEKNQADIIDVKEETEIVQDENDTISNDKESKNDDGAMSDNQINFNDVIDTSDIELIADEELLSNLGAKNITFEIESNESDISSVDTIPSETDIFEEFEKKKSQILNLDFDSEDEHFSKFSDLKFGDNFNLMDEDDF